MQQLPRDVDYPVPECWRHSWMSHAGRFAGAYTDRNGQRVNESCEHASTQLLKPLVNKRGVSPSRAPWSDGNGAKITPFLRPRPVLESFILIVGFTKRSDYSASSIQVDDHGLSWFLVAFNLQFAVCFAMNSEHRVAKGPRACTTCARAKSRCIAGPTSDKCERCCRLNKPCGTQTPAPPRRRKERKRTKVQELEQRLEDLTTRLESATGRDIPSSKCQDPVSSEGGSNSGMAYRGQSRLRSQYFMMGHLFPGGVVANPLPSPPEKSPLESRSSPGQFPDNYNTSTQAPAADTSSDRDTTEASTPVTEDYGAQHDPPPLLPPMPVCKSPYDQLPCNKGERSEGFVWPHAAGAEQYLTNYKKYAASLFPFVVIPDRMSAAQLLVERPYLWKGVMMHACHVDGQRQAAAGASLVKCMITASFCDAVKSLDMLQGLIVMVAWFHYNLNSTQLTNMFFLARAMAATLGLCDKVAKLRQVPPPELTASDLEETRTLAGVYYLLTLVFNANKKPDSLMDTCHIENCVAVLESRLDVSGDLLAVQFCRIQMLAQTIVSSVAEASRQPHQMPFQVLVKSFRQRIDNFRAEVPPSIAGNPCLDCHAYMAEILLYEYALNDGATQRLTPSERIPILWQTLQAAKGFTRSRTSVPFSKRQRFVCMAGFDYMYIFITCLKLVLLNLPGWDVLMVRQELSLEPFIDMQIREMETLTRWRAMGHKPGSVGGDWEPSQEMKQQDPFYRLGIKLRQLKFLFRVDPPEPTQSHPPDVGSATSVDPAISGVDVDMGLGLDFDGTGVELPAFDGFDPAYWHDIFNENAVKFYSKHMHNHEFPGDTPVLGNDLEPPSFSFGSMDGQWSM
ncbi:hypothetical protein MKZ38_003742 [Zalerion maritima]|uniref:Zn(2)-C6 fungal-type domain-containing protein n=1 Tax=Zalerion maritima TaxID=339359 RepID=A0AAD5RWN8_9PEZI|nr:hypothetical protein MKZ38_003742 [Zalerion maritima]